MDFSPRHRELVILLGRDGLSYKQAAAKLGISVHTVVSHVEAIVTRHRGDDAAKPRTVLSRLFWTKVAPSLGIESEEPSELEVGDAS